MAKIAILHEALGRSNGGIEAWIYHTSEELMHLGHQVTLFHTMGNDVPVDAAPTGVEMISLDRKKIKPSIFFIRSILGYRKQFSELLSGFDHVWARSFRMAWSSAKIVGTNKVVYINAAPYAYYAYRSFGSLIKKAENIRDITSAISAQLSYVTAWYFEKEAIKKCKNIYLSRERKDQTLSFFNLKDDPSRFMVVPAGVDYKRFKPASNLTKGDRTLNLISVSRLEKRKNIQCVIKAVKILIEEGYNINYSIIGDGEYREELVQLTKLELLDDYISFEGRQSNVEKWYQKNDLLVLPSLYEGFGNIYIEAMSSGLPCIAVSNKSGKYSVASDEIIDNGVNGYLMTENCPKLLADFIRNFITDKNLLQEFGSAAREKVLKEFTWQKTVNTILAK